MFRTVKFYNKSFLFPPRNFIRNFTVIRHADVNSNSPVKFFNKELAISEKGKQEIQNILIKTPAPKVIITSPRLRCIQTASEWVRISRNTNHSLSKDPEIVIDHDLKEIYLGELEGFHFKELENHPKYKIIWRRWQDSPVNFEGFPGGENLTTFQSRILTSFLRICHHYDPLSTCIITHGGPMRILKCFLSGKDLINWQHEPVQSLEISDLTPLQ